MATFMLPKLAIFDMDGTMLDTEPLSMEGWHAATKEMGINLTPAEFQLIFNKIIGTNTENCKAVLRQHLGETFETERAFAIHLAYMDSYFEKYGVPIKPGLIELLDKLEQLNIKKCVATSTQRERAAQKLTGIAHRFEVIVGGDDVTRSKPNPDIFLKAAKLCGIPPADCLVLEDSEAGTEGGYRAGMRVINIPDLVPPSDKVREMSVVVCKDLFEVVGMLES